MTKKPKIYVVVLNKGWTRSELWWTLIPSMKATEGVEVQFENPALSWAQPVSNNRNMIVKRFLETDADYLLMLDHDIMPLHNPALLAFAEKDIIGIPAKVRQKGHVTNWVAYVKSKKEGLYIGVDFTQAPPDIDLLEVDAIGAGCILIHRTVLEAIKAPFLEKFDEDGIVELGEDFAFCERAKEHGFKIYAHATWRCEHWHEVGLAAHDEYEQADGYYLRRQNLTGRKAIIGLGCGRCGTVSLAKLLSYQKGVFAGHEQAKFPWKFNEDGFMVAFPKIFYSNNSDQPIVSDTASWYLPYVGYIMGMNVDAKFICLKRDKDETVESWLRQTPLTCHFVETESEHWEARWLKQHPYRAFFPKYDLPERQAVERYYDKYYQFASDLEKEFPETFRVFNIDHLNSEGGVRTILDFAGIESDQVVVKSGIKLNSNKPS